MQGTDVTITKVGGPTVLIEINGVRLLTGGVPVEVTLATADVSAGA